MTFKFELEERDCLYFCVDREAGVELAPVFTFRQSALEIAHDCTSAMPLGQFKTNIPIVAVDSPFPRLPESIIGTSSGLHPKRDPKDPTKRHPLNPRN